MVGKHWTNTSPGVRLSLAVPPLLLVPIWRLTTGSAIGLAAASGGMLLVIGWMGYVAWRVAMNAHRRGNLFGETR